MITPEKVEQWIKEGKEITFSLLPNKSKLQDSSLTLQPFRDNLGKPVGRTWYEKLSREQEESGKYFPTGDSRVVIKNGFSMNLADSDIAADFKWVAYSPQLVDGIKSGKNNRQAQFYIEMPEEEAKEELSINRKKIKAAQYVEECTASMLSNVALLLGLNHTVPETMLRNDLVKIAMSDNARTDGYKGYQRIIAAFEDNLQRAKIMVLRGLEKNIFKREDGHYWYTPEGEESKRIGFNMDEAAEWLSLDKNAVFFRSVSEALDPEYAPKTRGRKKTE